MSGQPNVPHKVITALSDAKRDGIRKIVLSYNRLQRLPEQLLEPYFFQNLVFLELKRNLLLSLPDEINCLEQLQVLGANSNFISSLPQDLHGLHNLTSLDLSANRLESLPSAISHLQALVSLRVEQNQLHSLPAEIGQLVKLQVLSVGRNNLTRLPPCICHCVSLKSLSVDGNQLTSLPLELLNCHYLQEIEATRNNLLSLPYDLGHLPVLKLLLLDNNPGLTRLPASVLKMAGREQATLGLYQCSKVAPADDTEDDVGEGFCGAGGHVPPLTDLSLRCVVNLLMAWNQGKDRFICTSCHTNSLSDILPADLIPKLRKTGSCHRCGAWFFSSFYYATRQVHVGPLFRCAVDKCTVEHVFCCWSCLQIFKSEE